VAYYGHQFDTVRELLATGHDVAGRGLAAAARRVETMTQIQGNAVCESWTKEAR